jgi:hypothetical protein
LEYHKVDSNHSGSRDWHLDHEYASLFLSQQSVTIAKYRTGQVQIQMAFTPASPETPYFGYDNQLMNASVAMEYTGFTDLLLSWKFATFLADPGHSIDLTLQSEGAKPCTMNANGQDASACNRTYFIAGESLLVMPELVANSSFPDADILLASDLRGYLLNFNAGNSGTEFNSSQQCRTYSGRYFGIRVGAIRLCVGNLSPNELEARKFNVPSHFSAN